MSFLEDIENSNLLEYDTIIFDADETIWDITDSSGDRIPAGATMAPYSKTDNPDIFIDSNKNKIKFKDDFFTVINVLKNKNKKMYIVSFSEKPEETPENQPVILILKEAGILDFFEDIVIDSSVPKSKYVDKFDIGESVFLDDDADNISDVKENTKVDVINVKSASWYVEAVSSEYLDYDSLKNKINQDLKYAKDNVYTLRDSEGELKFRVNISNGEIIQVNPEFKKTNPKIYEGLKIPYRITKTLEDANRKKLDSFYKRINLIEEKEEENNKISLKNIEELFETTEEAKIKALKYINEQNEDNIENLFNSNNIFSKFVAGIVKEYNYICNKNFIDRVESKYAAEQIANYEVFDSFNGSETFRQENDIDYIPTNKKNISKKMYLKNNKETARKKMNYWAENGMYMYDDFENKIFSDKFKKRFGFYIEQCSMVESLTEKIFNKMHQLAGELIN